MVAMHCLYIIYIMMRRIRVVGMRCWEGWRLEGAQILSHGAIEGGVCGVLASKR